MFGYWIPEPVYRSKPYVLLAGGIWAAVATNALGAASGAILIAVGALIWKMRH